jgi:antitoxin ChpS
LQQCHTVSLVIQDGELLAESKRKISYKLADLLIEHQKIALEQNAWEGMKPAGREKI